MNFVFCQRVSFPQAFDSMNSETSDFETDDPVLKLLLSGQARSLEEAEEAYLDASLPEFYALLNGPLSDEELEHHPLVSLLVSRGSRAWEDSLL